MKNAFEILKTLWGNERSRALISLLLWFLFFGVCFLTLNLGGGKNYNSIPNEIDENKLDNYEYNMIVDINNYTYNISGVRLKEEETVKIEELDEIYSNNFENIDELKSLDLKYLRMETLKTYLNDNLKKSEIIYQDGSSKKEYEVSSTVFKINVLDKIESELPVKIEAKYKNDKLDIINLDLTNKMKLVNPKINKYKIRIIYSNIGNIKSLSK